MTLVKQFAGCIIVAALLAAVVVPNVDGQIKQGKTRAASTKQLMKGIVGGPCGALKGALEANPADDAAWANVALQAAILNESSYVLMDDGRCPDGDWKGACDLLRAGSDAVLKAAEKKDLAAAKAGFGDVGKSCGACHSKHKK